MALPKQKLLTKTAIPLLLAFSLNAHDADKNSDVDNENSGDTFEEAVKETVESSKEDDTLKKGDLEYCITAENADEAITVLSCPIVAPLEVE